jgi:excisionase family DNA binding protein
MRKHPVLPASTPSLPDLLTTGEVMSFLGISRQTICAWVRSSKLEAIRMPDSTYRFERAYIFSWLEARKTA